MKKRYFIYFATGILLAGLYSCEKTKTSVPYEITSNQNAFLKVNYASAYKANPAVQLKINDQRVSSSYSYPYPFPGGGLNTNGGSNPDYYTIPAGNTKISISLPKVGTDQDSLVIYSTTINVEQGKYYTEHIVDTSNIQSVLLPEDVSSSDSGFTKYRFVNLMPNQAALDLYFGTTKVASNIPFKGASPYFTLPQASTGQWIIRPAGADPTSAALTSYPTGTSLNTVPNQRVLTVFARGYSGITSSSDPRRGQVSLFYNR